MLPPDRGHEGRRQHRPRSNHVLEKYLRLQGWVEERKEGQGLGEYALILVLVSVVAYVALNILGTTISSVFNHIVSDL